MIPEQCIHTNDLKCHKCKAKIPKGEPMLFFAKGAYGGHLNTGQYCKKCTLKIAAKVCGTKCFTKKTIAFMVSEEV